MIYISNAALRYAVNICLELPNYHVIICPKSRGEWRDIIDQIVDYIPSLAINVSRIHTVKSGNCFIEFFNGSVIKFVAAHESSRGCRTNLVIVDSKVNDEFINAVLRPMEIKQLIEKR